MLKQMNKTDIFSLLVEHAGEVVPEIAEHEVTETDRLAELGANSVDRSEIIIMTLEALQLRVPLVEFAGAGNIGELAGLIHDKLQGAPG